MEKKVFSVDGKELRTVELNERVFGLPVNEDVIYYAINNELANKRVGTACTKDRAEVHGSNAKPYKQKGTGNARRGDKKSPLLRGGGVVFAPKPRDYAVKMNKKEKRAALKSVLTAKLNENKFVVIDEFKFDEIKTKTAVAMLAAVNAPKAIIVTDEKDNNVILSARNIAGVKTATVSTINVYDILKYDTVVASKAAVEKIQEVYA